MGTLNLEPKSEPIDIRTTPSVKRALQEAAVHHALAFDCGKEELNRFLKRFTLASQQANSAQTYVAARDGRVVGYYSLAVGGARHEAASPRVGKGLARQLIPVMVLPRLAVDQSEQGKGVGIPVLPIPCSSSWS